MRIAGKRLGLVVAVRADRGPFRLRRRRLRQSRAGGKPGEDQGADPAENPGFIVIAYPSS